MSCWTGWEEAFQKHLREYNLPADIGDIHFYEKEHSGMWGYWSTDGSSDFSDTIKFQRDENGEWQGDNRDFSFIVRA